MTRFLYSIHYAAALVSLPVRYHSTSDFYKKQVSDHTLSFRVHSGFCLNPLHFSRALLQMHVLRKSPFAPM